VIKKKDLPLEDKKVWEEYTKNPSNIYDKDKINTTENTRKERFKFDLHGFTLDEANLKVREIILSCIKKNYKEVLLSNTDKDIYVSKDLSKLKFSVPEFINNNNELNNYVFSITEANLKDGGAGAILIKLKNL